MRNTAASVVRESVFRPYNPFLPVHLIPLPQDSSPHFSTDSFELGILYYVYASTLIRQNKLFLLCESEGKQVEKNALGHGQGLLPLQIRPLEEMLGLLAHCSGPSLRKLENCVVWK